MRNNNHGVKLVFYRTLSSQSGASVTMGSIASSLRQNGYYVKLCFLLRSGLDSTLKIIEQSEKYPIIMAKPNFKDVKKLLSLLKKIKNKGIIKRVFLCGPFASLNAKNMMQLEPWLDGIIIGNPEETALELLNSLSDDLLMWNFSCSGGIWRIPKTGELIVNCPRKQSKSLDELPFPARDIETQENSAYINIEATRGCYYNCSFCHVPLFHDLNIVEKRMIRNPILVVEEIENIHRTLGKTLFIFNDPIFWSSDKDDERILTFCNEIKKRNLNIKLYVYLRCTPFPSEDIIKSPVETGLVRVFLGVENASSQSLKRYNKFLMPNDVKIAWNLLKKYKVNIHIGYIVFEPYSNLKNIEENIQYLHQLGKLFRIGVIIEPPRVIPCSKLCDDLIRDGLLDKNFNYYNLTYGFKFKNENVRNLFNALRDIFLQDLKKKWYQLEYYCVSGELLRTLAKKEKVNCYPKIDEQSKKFLNLVTEANILLYSFLLKSLELANLGKSKEEIRNNVSTVSFRNNFEELTDALAVEWGVLVKNIAKLCGEKPYRELYKGVEELWT